MKSSALVSLLFVAMAGVSTSAISQLRHDAPGSSHGVVRVSGAGVIKGIDTAGKKVTLEHDTINKFKMEAATHEFEVKNAKELANLKEGDKVKFALESAGQDLVVVQIGKSK